MLGAVAGKPNESLEYLAVMRSICDRAERLVWLIFGHSVEALDLFGYQVETQPVDRFRVELESAYAGNRLACLYKLTNLSVVAATSL